MFIVNALRNRMYNVDEIGQIHTQGQQVRAELRFKDDHGILGKYDSEETAEFAFQILMERMKGSPDICLMPNTDEVRIEQKTKGHGGS